MEKSAEHIENGQSCAASSERDRGAFGEQTRDVLSERDRSAFGEQDRSAQSASDELRLRMLVDNVAHLLQYGQGTTTHALAPAQRRVLGQLATRGAMTQQQLLDELAVSPSSLSEVVTKLEERGLVERGKSEQDRRRTIITLTGAGTEIAQEMLAADEKIAQDVFAPLGDAEKQQLEVLLDTITRNWVK